MCYNSLVDKEGQLKTGNQLGQATRYLSACGVFGLMVWALLRQLF